jgi:hypothetical protein
MYDVLVCDPDEKQFEGTALGLLYTAVSRATTLGTRDGLESALYFTGRSFTESRIRNLTTKEDGKEFELSIKRRYWVQHIKTNTELTKQRVKGILSQSAFLLEWAANTTMTYDALYNRIATYKSQCKRRKRKTY